MQAINLIQGTEQWHDFRKENYPASEAPAMMGVSKFIPKTPEVLAQYRLGIKEQVIDDFTQRIFDEGHAMEDAARPILAKLTEEIFAPTVGRIDIEGLTKGVSASFDGINFDGDTLFEHKKWNTHLAEQVRNENLEPHYIWQLEQQLMVSGAKQVIFVTSDSFIVDKGEDPTQFPFYSDTQVDAKGNRFYTAANFFEMMVYTHQDGYFDELIEGWKRYEAIEKSMIVQNPKWERSAQQFKKLNSELSGLKTEQKAIEKELKPIKEYFTDIAKQTQNSRVVGSGIEVVEVTRKGSIDCQKIIDAIADAIGAIDDQSVLEFLKVDSWEKLSKPTTSFWQVKELKEKKTKKVA